MTNNKCPDCRTNKNIEKVSLEFLEKLNDCHYKRNGNRFNSFIENDEGEEWFEGSEPWHFINFCHLCNRWIGRNKNGLYLEIDMN